MKIAVIQFPGANCERETMLAIQRAEMVPVPFLWNEPREKLRAMDGYVIVGGFSYEDRSRAGIIAALDPILTELKTQSEQGKPILGICNGAQILVESGLVPGLENHKVAMALTENKRVADGKILGTGYYNAWVHMRLSDTYQRNAFTRHLTPRDILRVPVAHAEGRFFLSPVLLEEMTMQGLNVFVYCDAQGQVIDRFPINPNGSVANIAAVSNKAGNVLAMMPHPERTTTGDAIFHSMRDYLRGTPAPHHIDLYYYPRQPTTPVYQLPAQHTACAVSLMITDNQAVTVQNTLKQLGIAVSVKRWQYWEMACESPETIAEIKQTEVLFNPRKETVCTNEPWQDATTVTLLVLAKEDLVAQQKRQTLADHFGISDLHALRHGVLWQFKATTGSITALKQRILKSNIIANPYAHDCYDYIG